MGVRNCVVDSDAGAVEITVPRSQQRIYLFVSNTIPSSSSTRESVEKFQFFLELFCLPYLAISLKGFSSLGF